MNRMRIHFEEPTQMSLELADVEIETLQEDSEAIDTGKKFVGKVLGALGMLMIKFIDNKHKSKLIRRVLKWAFIVAVTDTKHVGSAEVYGVKKETVVTVFSFTLVIFGKPIWNRWVEKYSIFSPVKKARDGWLEANKVMERATENQANFLKND